MRVLVLLDVDGRPGAYVCTPCGPGYGTRGSRCLCTPSVHLAALSSCRLGWWQQLQEHSCSFETALDSSAGRIDGGAPDRAAIGAGSNVVVFETRLGFGGLRGVRASRLWLQLCLLLAWLRGFWGQQGGQQAPKFGRWMRWRLRRGVIGRVGS